MDEEALGFRLDQISTRWSRIVDVNRFVLRYAPAIHRYLFALLKNEHDVEEVTQDFLTKLVGKGFVPEQVNRGRFRDYLRSTVRNAAFAFLRRKPRLAAAQESVLESAADPASHRAEEEWSSEWRTCLLERAWQALESHQSENPDNPAFTVLRLKVDHPDASSDDLAAKASKRLGRAVRADAFRKQISRARRLFAGFLVQEVVQTLEQPTRQDLEDELSEIGLLAEVRAYLPAD